MATNNRTTDAIYSNGTTSKHFSTMRNWFASNKNGKVPSILDFNPKLNAEIHLAIIDEPSEYASSICDHLFTLYHDVKHRPFVLQFLPSFVIAYYDVLYHHRHSESVDATTKDVCSTIDTFLVSLYNLTVTDDGQEKVHEFRIPNLTLPSVYHTPNPDHYAPTPLTQHAISKHEKKCEIIRLQSFTPFDTVNGKTREQILWFLLIQYGVNVSSMDKYSRQSYLRMSKKILGQGFSFDGEIPTKTKSLLPPTGRRIHVSSRIMSEILGTLFYFKSNSLDKEASECMRLLKKRAEYEMYSDVILMTESMSYLHEFESQRPEKQDSIGIEIELPPTIDMVRQKRTATTTRSIKTRQRTSEPNEITVLNDNSPTTISHQRSSNKPIDETSLKSEQSSPSIDIPRTYIESSIGPAASTPSPSSTRHYKPVSLSSTQTYFQNIRQRGTSPVLQTKTIHPNNENDETLTIVTRPKPSRKKDMIATVRFPIEKSDENGTNIEETYL